MEKDQLYSNRAQAAAEMARQTGKEPGGPTGVCDLFVAHALTGNPVRYIEGMRKSWVDEESFNAGLIMHAVEHPRKNPLTVIPDLLNQKRFGVDALVIQGEVKNHNIGHMVAIVSTETHAREGSVTEYHVVDSLVEGGLVTYATQQEALDHTAALFIPKTVHVAVKPTDDELSSRGHNKGEMPISEMLEVADGIFIEIPIKLDDPRFRGPRVPEVSTKETLEQDQEALMKVIGAIIDDQQSETPFAKHGLYEGFATVAARYDMHYPLLDELSDEHTVFETKPTRDGSFDMQLSASTLRAARRLVELYSQDQHTDPVLPVVNTDAQIRFLNEQIAHYKRRLFALGEFAPYAPRKYTEQELAKTSEAVAKEAKERGLELMKPVQDRVLSSGEITRFGYGFVAKEKKWLFGSKKTSESVVLDIHVPTGGNLPLVYGDPEGKSTLLLVDGRGTPVKKMESDTVVRATALNAEEVRATEMVLKDSHVGDIVGTKKASFILKNTQVNRLGMFRSARVLDTQIGTTSIIAGATIEGARTDVGQITVNGHLDLIDGDIIDLHVNGHYSSVNVRGGECSRLIALDQSDTNRFTSHPDEIYLERGTRYSVEDENDLEQVYATSDGSLSVCNRRYILLPYEREDLENAQEKVYERENTAELVFGAHNGLEDDGYDLDEPDLDLSL